MLIEITGDLESRSKIDIIKSGMHRYAEHPSTQITCFAIKVNRENTRLWIAPEFRHLDLEKRQDLFDDEFKELVSNMERWESHNCAFEYTMWKHIMVKRYGFPELPIKKLYCSAARAAAMSLPRSLGMACDAMDLKIRKDKEGSKIMLRLCKPRSPLKKEKEANPNWMHETYWDETPEKYDRLFLYCKQDVEAEFELSKSIPPLTDDEQEIWRLDLIINERGLSLDVDNIEALINKVEEQEEKLSDESLNITRGKARSSQRAEALKWIASKKVPLYGYDKKSIASYLDSGLYIPDDVGRFLEIRQALGLTSIAKLKKVPHIICDDGRARGLFLYAGARTLRWTGKLFQPHNLPRESFNSKEEVDEFLDSIGQYTIKDFFNGVTKCIRPMIKAKEGHTFICGDFSAIESRVLSWLVGDKTILDAYQKGKEVYKINASNIYKVPYEEVTSDQRFVGKIAELSLGYQGGVGAFMGMLSNYGVTDIEEEEVRSIINAWRSARYLVKNYWYELEEKAIRTVKTKKPNICGRVKFWMHDEHLRCDLPDGTTLSYLYARVQNVETPIGLKECITFYGVFSDKDKLLEGNNAWGKSTTYGGKLCENIVQSLARKILAESMLRLEKFKFKTVMHVHDEVVCEMPINRPHYLNKELFENIMEIRPSWAKKLPLEVKAWEGARYRK